MNKMKAVTPDSRKSKSHNNQKQSKFYRQQKSDRIRGQAFEMLFEKSSF